VGGGIYMLSHPIKRFIEDDLNSTVEKTAIESCMYSANKISSWISDDKLIEDIPFGFIYFLNEKKIFQDNSSNRSKNVRREKVISKTDFKRTLLALKLYQREWLIEVNKYDDLENEKIYKQLDYFGSLSKVLKIIIDRYKVSVTESRYFVNENGINFKCYFKIKGNVYIRYIDRGESSTYIQVLLGHALAYSNRIDNLKNFDIISFIQDLVVNGVGRIGMFESRKYIPFLEHKYPYYHNQEVTSFY